MNINKKWSAAAAGLLAIALVGGGAVPANAAEGDILNPQPEGSAAAGSKGGYYLFDGDAIRADTDPTRVFAKDEYIFGAADAIDYLAEINPAATRPVSGSTPFTNVYKFLAEKTDADVQGGINTWNAYAVDAAAGPNGGTLTPELTLQSLVDGPGGTADDIAAGGSYWYGIAYTYSNGVQVAGAVYREITIEAGTGNFTFSPMVIEGPAAAVPVAEADLTPALENPALVTETVDSKILAIDAGVAQANQTLSYGTFPAGLTGQVTLDANGAGTIDATAIPVNQVTKLYLAQSDNTVVAWDSFNLTTSQVQNDTTDLTVAVTNSGKFAIVAPAAQTIDLGNVRRNRVTAPVALGSVSVFDDRDVLSGWDLNITSSAFAGPGGTTVAAIALGYAPVGTTLVDGVTVGDPKVAGEGTFGVLATALAGSATGEFEPVVIDTDLTFKAPINAAKGVHTGVLTLDLVTK